MSSTNILTHNGLNVKPRIEDVLSRLKKVHKTARGWAACCPAHDDRSPSLSIGVTTDGRILLHCFAGCPYEEIVRALGFEPHELNPHKSYHRPLTQKEKEQAQKQATERALNQALEKWAAASYLKLATFRRALFKSLAEPNDYFEYPEFVHSLQYIDYILDCLTGNNLKEMKELLNLYLQEKLGIAGRWLS